MKKKTAAVVGDHTHNATDLVRDALYAAGDYIGELGDTLGPRAREIGEHVVPAAQEWKKKGVKLVHQAKDDLSPRLDDARRLVAPYVDDAYGKLAPTVEAARGKVEQALHELADNPKAKEANKRLAAAAAALAGELDFPAPSTPEKKKGAGKTVAQALLAAGLATAVAFAVKKLLSPEDAGWQAHEPSKAYQSESEPKGPSPVTEPVDPWAKPDAETTWETPASNVADEGGNPAHLAGDASVSEDLPITHGDLPAAEDALTEDHDTPMVEELAEGDADPFVVSPYGAGSFVGNESPEGFFIKGNERSMKYHLPASGGYAGTIADVWFNSEEAAQAAGFTRAQR